MYRELVDFAIGITPDLPLSKTIVESNVRFDIPSEIIDKGEGVLTVLPSGTEVTLTFQDSEGHRKSSFPGTVFGTGAFFPDQGLPKKYAKYRFEYPLGEIILAQDENSEGERMYFETKFNIEIDRESINIRELWNTWRVITLLQNKPKVGAELVISRLDFPPLRLGIQDAYIPDSYQVIAEAIENAWILARYLEIEEVNVSVDEILRQREDLAIARMLIQPNQPPFRVITMKIAELEKTENDHAIVIGRTIVLENYQVFVAAGMAGPVRYIDSSAEYELSRPVGAYVERFFLSRKLNMHDAMLSMYNSLRKRGYEVIEFEEFRSEEEE